ncbi:flagellar associated protein [Reticulomyxa filosa]|uniref:Flagellar associated protein n=1 Tax=Reticulomyxa filosa TaxID=46433 RepID=X6MEG0_RETFI|nr:flagellar associated protein [Reticulomyxa filosa]|eukprot:ETO12061.1 flagellar associated protein [Reticulomyxa filosa]
MTESLPTILENEVTTNQTPVEQLLPLQTLAEGEHKEQLLSNTKSESVRPNESKQKVPYKVQRLDDICVSQISKIVNICPHLMDELPPEYIDSVVSEIDLQTLQVNECAPSIKCETLWKRMARERWKNCQLENHGYSWKRLYLEKHVQQTETINLLIVSTKGTFGSLFSLKRKVQLEFFDKIN